jgi:GTP pyrophosphokinase
VAEVMRNSKTYLDSLKRAILRHMRSGSVEVIKIEARQKHYYSIYKKLLKTDGNIKKIYDLMAVRIIVPDVAACYQALGVLHQQYKPLIYRIKDYIAVPKPNGYQSLHTTVFGEDGRISEIQIRTPEMHQAAEFGLAAHFFYDAKKSSSLYAKRKAVEAVPASLSWVTELAQLKRVTKGGEEFVERARLELFADRIFAFSPKGDLYDLPEGATPLDFAFAIHSNIGLRTMGARINGKHVPLDVRLENRDVVEIMTRKEAAPSRDWLGVVVTSHAKSRIRAWFRTASKANNVAAGRAALEAELQTWGVKRVDDLGKRAMAEAVDGLHLRSAEEMFALLGEGSMTLMQAIRRLVPNAAKPKGVTVVKRKEPTGRVLVEKSELPYTLAPCCAPVFPQVLIGYVTRGKGVTVHALGCRNMPSDHERYASCRWETADAGLEMLACRIAVKAANRFGLLSDLTSTVAKRNFNMANIHSEVNEAKELTTVEFTVEVPDFFELAKLIRSLSRLPGVSRVSRISY